MYASFYAAIIYTEKKHTDAIAYRIPMAFDDLQLDAFRFK